MKNICLSVLLVFSAFTVSAQTELPTAVDLGHETAYKGLTLSPDGKILAYNETIRGDHRLFLLDLATDKKLGLELLGNNKALAHSTTFFWANNKRFVYNAKGLYTAIDRDGRNGRSGIKGGRLLYTSRDEKNPILLMTGNDVVVQEGTGPIEAFWANHRPFVQRVNPQGVQGMATGLNDAFEDNGSATREVENPGNVEDWVVDAAGQVRAGKEIKANRYHVLYRSSDKGSWQSLPGLGWEDPQAFPLGFSDDGRTMYVGRVSPAGTWAIYPYDLTKNALGEPILAHVKFDIVHPLRQGAQGLIYSPKERRLLGVRYHTEFPRVLWLDPELAEVQAALDQALPRKINTITSMSDDLQKMVVLSSTAQDPGTYYLFDRSGPKLEQRMSAMPWIKPEQMSDMKPFRFKSRDGVLLNGYLMLPVGREAKHLPLIVLSYGIERPYWGFDAHAQFWASRGYAVMKVGTRGQAGYGEAHYNAVNGQIDRLVAADMADAVRWAISQKVVDPARVGIVGLGDLGGYFALQSLVTEPELYRCAVEHAGYTDWSKTVDRSKIMPDGYELMMERFGAAASAEALERVQAASPNNTDKTMKERVGGSPSAETVAKMQAASPIYNVDKIQTPLLITYNRANFAEDWINNQSKNMAEKMKAAGKTVELISDYDEAYGYETMAKYLNDRLAFVQKYMPADK